MTSDVGFPTVEMDAVKNAFQGRLGFQVLDMDTGAGYACDGTERFPTASVCKIAVLVELFRQVDQGVLHLGDRRRLAGAISTHGSGALSWLVDGPELSLRDYCRMMMSISDNIATDMLMSVVGLENINTTLDVLCCPNVRTSTTMGRYHYAMAHMEHLPCNPENDERFIAVMRSGGLDFGSLPYSDSLSNNVAAPTELADLLARIWRGEVVSKAASGEMLEMLKLCNDRRMICRYLRPGIEVAHKSGSSGRIKGNAGIIMLPSGPLVVVAFALAAADDADGGLAIAEISRLAVSALSPHSIVPEKEL